MRLDLLSPSDFLYFRHRITEDPFEVEGTNILRSFLIQMKCPTTFLIYSVVTTFGDLILFYTSHSKEGNKK